MRGHVVVEHTVLFAVVGMTPSVLTETIWALAVQKKAVIPDRVVVLTTTAGRESIKRALFDELGAGGGWARLIKCLSDRGLNLRGRLRFGMSSDHVRLFPSPCGSSDLDDICTSEENAVAADFILKELRAYTESPGTTVLASIAGGRKTMSALLMSCMSLLGRSQDRVLHVLVNSPFDAPLNPPFLFPENNVLHCNGTHTVSSTEARIELIDVPFVRMRGWYEGAFRTAPPRYAALVAGVQRQAPEPQTCPVLTLNRSTGVVEVAGGDPVLFSPTEFAALALLCQGEILHERLTELLKRLNALKTTPETPDWVCKLQAGKRFSKDADCVELRKSLSSARSKLAKHPLLAGFAEALVPKRGKPQRYPAKRLRFSGPDVFADIRG